MKFIIQDEVFAFEHGRLCFCEFFYFCLLCFAKIWPEAIVFDLLGSSSLIRQELC